MSGTQATARRRERRLTVAMVLGTSGLLLSACGEGSITLPTALSTALPTIELPTALPTLEPTQEPVPEPTVEPSPEVTAAPDATDDDTAPAGWVSRAIALVLAAAGGGPYLLVRRNRASTEAADGTGEEQEPTDQP